MTFLSYGQEEMDYLCNRDAKLATAIDYFGKIERTIYPDVFAALVRIIVGQQISTKAQANIWQRLTALFPITPENIARCPVEILREVGLSARKVVYIQGIAEAVLAGKLDLAALENLSDEDIKRVLLPLKGIGAWSVEMLLIFSLQRPNVLSFGDLGIIRGMKKLYQKETISQDFFQICRKNYSPYGSIASLYLWAVGSDPADIFPPEN